jgi:DNA transformation protein
MSKPNSSTDETRLSGLQGLGPKSEQALFRIGIVTVEQLKARDPFEVYAQLRAKVPGTTLNALYALIGAISNTDWRAVKRERRMEILLRLEQMGLAPR